MRGKVKKVQQRSYVAIAKGPQAVDKGEKKGQFFVYEFGENGQESERGTVASGSGSMSGKRFRMNMMEKWEFVERKSVYTGGCADGEPELWIRCQEGRLRALFNTGW